MAPKAVLVGMPGSGKSTIGRRLAKATGSAFLDTDAQIVEVAGRPIAEIFATDGEAEFRRIEEEVIKTALAEHDGILSLGGGAITSPGVRDALAGHTVVYLEISAAEGVRRTTSGTVRPLLAGGDPAEKFRKLMTERVPLYRRVATLRVNTNRRNPGAVVRYLAARLENPEAARPTKAARRRRRPPWRQSGSQQAAPAAPAESAQEPSPRPSPPTPATPAALAARRSEVRK
ncbi:shikimate kinase [[Mycobacterium] wendilense]|uniref:Shikimate kinase n=1 Tax=[Mycobacterium] wendilense TaxID=3064284 RepID=A0ABM9MER9_9MYCO|nr:shikimate kinase [Mycolicibacterium sp. MU0050]CAJ1583425.1 shikimate kinase [Mycolicibacterium sp. MU0050]